jgi:hypothetical protein
MARWQPDARERLERGPHQALDASVATLVGAGCAHGIARLPFTKAKVSQASKDLRDHIGLAGVWPCAVRGPVCVPKTEAAGSALLNE